MIGYPNFIMDPKELDKVFNDVSGFLHLPRRLPEAPVSGGRDGGYPPVPAWYGVGFRDMGMRKVSLFLCVPGSVGGPVSPEPLLHGYSWNTSSVPHWEWPASGREWGWLGQGASGAQHELRVCEAISSIPNTMGQKRLGEGGRTIARHGYMCL